MKDGHRRMEMVEANLVWIDCEFTGLNPDVDRIIEIATLVTDSELNIIAEGPSLVIHQSEEQLALMDEWNVTHHTENGLIERVRAEAGPVSIVVHCAAYQVISPFGRLDPESWARTFRVNVVLGLWWPWVWLSWHLSPSALSSLFPVAG